MSDTNPQRTRTLTGGNIQPLADKTTIYSRPNPFGTDLGFQGTVIELVTEAQFAAGIAQDWAMKTDGMVGTLPDGTPLYSSKYWAEEARRIQGTVSNIAANAAGSASSASDAASRAVAEAGAARNARDKANMWAEAGRGVEVEPGHFSARHWAMVALDNAIGGLKAQDIPLDPPIAGLTNGPNVQLALAEIQANKASRTEMTTLDQRVTTLAAREDARYNEQQQLSGRVDNLRTDLNGVIGGNLNTRLTAAETKITSLETSRTLQGTANTTFASRIAATEGAIANINQFNSGVSSNFAAQNNWNNQASARFTNAENAIAARLPLAGGTVNGNLGVTGTLTVNGWLTGSRISAHDLEARNRLWAYGDVNFGLFDDASTRHFLWAEGWADTWSRSGGTRAWNRPGMQQMRLDWDGSLYVAGTGGLSDERTKHVVGKLPLERAIRLVLASQASIFSMKDDPENRLRLGPIAQDILAVAPEAMGKPWPRAGLPADPHRGSPKDEALTLDNGNALPSALSTVVAHILDRLAALEGARG